MRTTLPIVGAFHRPPAQAILDTLRIGTPLWLCCEPDNPADSNAIRVYIQTIDFPPENYRQLEEAIGRYGFEMDEFIQRQEWHLGYIPKHFAANLRLNDFASEPIMVEYATAADGSSPRVRTSEDNPFPC